MQCAYLLLFNCNTIYHKQYLFWFVLTSENVIIIQKLCKASRIISKIRENLFSKAYRASFPVTVLVIISTNDNEMTVYGACG